MSSLLPYNATAQEQALDLATGRISDVPVVSRETANPDTCPAVLLPWLAWAYSVDEWDVNWTEEQKRESIKRAAYVQKYKGTIGAVTEALGALGYPVRVQEWFSQLPIGTPYTFRLLIETDQTGVDQGAFAKLYDVLNRYKNLRSHLDRVDVISSSATKPYIGGVALLGTEITVSAGDDEAAMLIYGFRPAEDTINTVVNIELPNEIGI